MKKHKNELYFILMFTVCAIVYMLTLSGCQTTQETPQGPPPAVVIDPVPTPIPDADPIAQEPIKLPWANPSTNAMAKEAWGEFLMERLDSHPGLLQSQPTDVYTFCPAYTKEKAKEFWASLLATMTVYESSSKTEAKYQENFKDSKGRYIVSRGLLQLSIESANGGYACGFKTEQDLHDPLQNLACGIKIMEKWVLRDGQIAGKVSGSWRGGARYWSVLRNINHPYQKILNTMKSIEVCR